TSSLAALHDALPIYESADELKADIELIAHSLETNKGQHAGLFAVRRLLRRIETFGFHMVTLDVRQDAMVHREVIGECLGDDQWLDRKSTRLNSSHVK